MKAGATLRGLLTTLRTHLATLRTHPATLRQMPTNDTDVRRAAELDIYSDADTLRANKDRRQKRRQIEVS